MDVQADQSQRVRSGGWSGLLTILIAGGGAGAIDFIYVTTETVLAGGGALRPWKGVAAALFGVSAVVGGGEAIGLIGIALHFLITIVAAAIYFAAAMRVRSLIRHPWPAGVAFGILFLLAMNYLILPLSVMGHPLYVGSKGIFDAMISHVLLIGLPISLLTAMGLRDAR
jgi:hypothetical protein